jgi:hypothetical protein
MILIVGGFFAAMIGFNEPNVLETDLGEVPISIFRTFFFIMS